MIPRHRGLLGILTRNHVRAYKLVQPEDSKVSSWLVNPRLQLPRSFCKTPTTTIPSQSRKVIVFIVANHHTFFKRPRPVGDKFYH